ncbi:MAG: toll/interleukin-1 receptor domain-containing protein [Sedimentibacter sp.]
MQQENIKAFVSYSWDSKSHQQWVLDLTNDLRKKGINATMDIFETQLQTINLNTMMVSKIKSCDYIIIVLTENYAKKADDLKGGVGFETILTMPYLRENMGKIILLMRHQGDYTKVFPFHYKDVYAIDFSDDIEYEDKLDELIYKIYNVPIYEMAELGPIPNLMPKTNINHSENNTTVDKRLIPNLKKITDIDKRQFLIDSYLLICRRLKQLFEQTKKTYGEFDYTNEEITNRKTIFYAYLDGNKKAGIKIWFGNSIGSSEAIYIQYGTYLNESNDGSFNEIINCEVIDNTLKLKKLMSVYGNSEIEDIDSMVEEIWLHHIKNYLER